MTGSTLIRIQLVPQTHRVPGEDLPAEPRHRETCNVCGLRIEDPSTQLVRIRCNVRRFAHEYFHMWRCRRCHCMHCWEHVHLDAYYEDYGSQRMQLDFFLKRAYKQLYRHFWNAGMRRDHRFLDFGCGAGHFVTYLRGRGHRQAVGYDPYGRPDGWIDRSVLQPESYDFINLYDVIEHVEDPTRLLSDLAGMLRPGGALLVGTPSADEIDLRMAHQYLHHIHLPYHLHIYTRDVLAQMGPGRSGWSPSRTTGTITSRIRSSA